jgi:hypothetical protein
MSQHQTTVIWLGLVLIALNLILNLAELKSVIFSGSTGGGSGGGSHGITIPLDPFLPGPLSPHITIPLVQTTPSKVQVA